MNRFWARLQFWFFLNLYSCLLTTNLSGRNSRSRAGLPTLFNFRRNGKRQWISITFHYILVFRVRDILSFRLILARAVGEQTILSENLRKSVWFGFFILSWETQSKKSFTSWIRVANQFSVIEKWKAKTEQMMDLEGSQQVETAAMAG